MVNYWLKVILVFGFSMLLFDSFSKAYNKGRLGGTDPSADYLRDNPYLLDNPGQNSELEKQRYRQYGSSPYTPENFRKAIYDGDIFWTGKAFSWKYPRDGRMPTICTNKEELRSDSNGTKLGYFICPMAHEPVSMVYCCGEEEAEYCCDSLTAKIFYFVGRTSEDDARDVGIVFAILGAIFLPFIVGICLFGIIIKKCC